MRSRGVFVTLVLVIAVVALAILKFRYWDPKKRLLFNRNPSRIEYTKHAICRMECRHISIRDINEILKNGNVNLSKTNLHDKPCPTFVLQGYTSGGDNLRVVFAQCGSVERVVTCYNLKEDFFCDCPGDHPASVSFNQIHN